MAISDKGGQNLKELIDSYNSELMRLHSMSEQGDAPTPQTEANNVAMPKDEKSTANTEMMENGVQNGARTGGKVEPERLAEYAYTGQTAAPRSDFAFDDVLMRASEQARTATGENERWLRDLEQGLMELRDGLRELAKGEMELAAGLRDFREGLALSGGISGSATSGSNNTGTKTHGIMGGHTAGSAEYDQRLKTTPPPYKGTTASTNDRSGVAVSAESSAIMRNMMQSGTSNRAGAAQSLPADDGSTGYGYLRAIVYTARQAQPLEGAQITIFRPLGGESVLYGTVTTDRDGRTPLISLPIAQETSPGNMYSPPSLSYSVRVSKDGYETQDDLVAQIYEGASSTLPVEMIPVNQMNVQ